MNARTHARLLSLVVFCTALGVGAVEVARRLEQTNFDRLVTLQADTQARLLEQSVDLHLQRAKTLSVDYSYWDEVVDYIAAPDEQWARDNLDSALLTYQVDAIWLFQADGATVPGVTSSGARMLEQAPWSAAQTKDFLAHGPFQQRFVDTPLGPMAIFAATVHPSDDVAHRTAPRGLLVVGKRLDDALLTDLSTSTATSVALVDAVLPSRDQGVVVAGIPVPGADGAPISWLESRGPIAALQEIREATNRMILWQFAVAGVVLAIATLALRTWVVKPLERLSEALATGKTEPLASLRDEPDEFGSLALLVEEFFTQKSRLEREYQERGLLARALEHRAMHDVLTGLPNRALFQDRLRVAMARADRHGGNVAVVVVDLDKFKQINDSHGHAIGDGLLVAVGQRLLAAVRVGDTVARFGGDEFAMILAEVSTTDAALMTTRRLLDTFRAPFAVEGMTLQVSPSMGVCLYPSQAKEANDLLQRADLAMYEVKRDGRNAVRVWTPPVATAAAPK